MDESSPSRWSDLFELVDSLPDNDRRRFERAIGNFAHDVKQSIAVIHTAQALLRRGENLTPQDIEILDMIQRATQRSLNEITEFARPFDRSITLPLRKLPD